MHAVKDYVQVDVLLYRVVDGREPQNSVVRSFTISRFLKDSKIAGTRNTAGLCKQRLLGVSTFRGPVPEPRELFFEEPFFRTEEG